MNKMRKMKDSGIAWIGEIPEGWKVYELRRIGLFSASGIDKKIVEGEPLVRIINYTDVYGNKNYILCAKDYMTVSAPIEKIKEHQVEIGDVIFTPSSETVEDIGVSAVVMEELENTAYSYHVLRFRFFIDVCNAYKKYMFNNAYIQNYYSSRAVGSIRKTLSRDDFKGTKVCLPDFCEQQKIADFLDKKCAEIDKLIELQDSMIDKLKEYKQSVITQAVTKGLDPDVPMKDSGIEWIGKIPEGWRIAETKSIFNIYTGATPKSDYEEFWDGDINWITPADYKTQDVFVSCGKRKISEKGLNSCSTYLIPAGGLIFSKRAPIGSVAIAQNELCTNQGCLSCVAKLKIEIKYYYYLISTLTAIYELFGAGTTFKEISTNAFSSFKLVLPDFIEQQQIADYLDKKCAEIDDLIKLKEQKIEKLKEYKKSLIYEYVTGKKEVV